MLITPSEEQIRLQYNLWGMGAKEEYCLLLLTDRGNRPSAFKCNLHAITPLPLLSIFGLQQLLRGNERALPACVNFVASTLTFCHSCLGSSNVARPFSPSYIIVFLVFAKNRDDFLSWCTGPATVAWLDAAKAEVRSFRHRFHITKRKRGTDRWGLIHSIRG